MATALDPDLFECPVKYNKLPVRALQIETHRLLAKYLDLEGSLTMAQIDNIRTDIVNDISGLAKLAGQDWLDITNSKQSNSPTMTFLATWNDENATIGKLWEYLRILQRDDVIIDCRQHMLSDCQKFLDQKEKAMKQNTGDTRGHDAVHEPWYYDEMAMPDDSDGELAMKAMRVEPDYPYDAFVCYNQEDPEDDRFVQKLIQELEARRGLTLFVPGRDDLPGASENINTADQIERRCRRVIIVISRSLLQSSLWNFQERFAQALSPDARNKRLIPIIREEGVVVPRALQVYNTFDFTNTDTFEATTDGLTSAITGPLRIETYLGRQSHEALQDISWPRDHTTPKAIMTSGTGPNIQEEETFPKTLAILDQPHPVLQDTTSNSENSKPQECEGDMTSEVMNNPYGPEALHSDPVQGSDESSTMGDLEPEEAP